MTTAAARFAQAMARLLPDGGRIGLAVSGGADSTAMLLLAHAAIPGRFDVATVNHGLRAGAAAECAQVADMCAARDIECVVLEVTVPPGNVQAEARGARYSAMADWAQARGLAALATAHQADDQAETVLLRLARGSGVAGLAGIRERGTVPGAVQGTDLPLLRPMLAFCRAECEAIVAAEGINWVRDPSNDDARFDRVRMRQLLAAMPLGSPAAVLVTAANCADADAALEWATDREWAERVTVDDGQVRYAPQAPRAIALRIIDRAIAMLGGAARGGQVADLHDALTNGGGGNAGGVLARLQRGEWVFGPEPSRRG